MTSVIRSPVTNKSTVVRASLIANPPGGAGLAHRDAGRYEFNSGASVGYHRAAQSKVPGLPLPGLLLLGLVLGSLPKVFVDKGRR
jgi:hypothetical protein